MQLVQSTLANKSLLSVEIN